MKNVEIYFHDLKPEAQAAVLALNRISSPEEANWEFVPLFILEEPDFEEDEEGSERQCGI